MILFLRLELLGYWLIPLKDWQMGPQGPQVFSPRILTVDGVTRLFYSQNPGNRSPAGWAYLTYSPEV